ncbi:arabinan endo-1,5-alpha-L-arabinosidase [Mucilaginibacter mallensis]|uniref:Arabinan endo-1,5-alpha-L-arabinosidase n=1 Tax=Mucilaginibacter mallensis TaxID=652787 RepID=A0A1H1U8Y9_MUCMA|nr:arabinan endo-1,5-alpha-L-arabinosidase [Mucilaginibacter mallensis]SDS68958.1 arabinan endo-1,5-alpha-L-arabinosidase [Mucilaginibacter mallensis]
MKKIKYLSVIAAAVALISSCGKKGVTPSGGNGTKVTTDTTVTTTTFNINSIEDTYADVAPFLDYSKWTVYNVHDPSIKKFGDYYYCYSTDVAYGITVRSGIQIRRSKDLVQWEFVGWVFSQLPALGSQYIVSQGGTPYNALWAPYVSKVGNQYRLYYSLSSATPRLSVIGMATATDPAGPWTETGLVVSSTNNSITQTNAIDPTVVTTAAGDQYMYYGSAWDGIYILKLNPTTGLAATSGDIGVRIANRGFTNGVYNGNIEGSEVIYNPTLKKYFLFISYDWLQTKYNVRVGRADSPTGPYYDYNGVDLNTNIDHGPMIVAPYQFTGHGGWQGTGHCGVFDDGNGQYYMAHQGRPAVNSYFMDLHVRKIEWTPDGWPIVLPERYANVVQTAVAAADLAGKWERIELDYHVVPGYADTQVSPDMQVATSININADGTISGTATGTWTYTAPWMLIKWSTGATENVIVKRERDWENSVATTLVYSGLNNTGIAVWGKKR